MGRFVTNGYLWFAVLIGAPDVFVFNGPLMWPLGLNISFLIFWYLRLHNFWHLKSNSTVSKPWAPSHELNFWKCEGKRPGKIFSTLHWETDLKCCLHNNNTIIAGTFPHCLNVGTWSHSLTCSALKGPLFIWRMLFFQLHTQCGYFDVKRCEERQPLDLSLSWGLYLTTFVEGV